MSHGLDFNSEGLARFAYQVRHLDKIWHRHGTQIAEELTTLPQWLAAAKMDHLILQAPLYAKIDGEFVEVDTHKAVYRDSDGKLLSIMGAKYRVVQTREAWEMLERLVSEGWLKIDTMGTLNGGRRTFVAASLTGDNLQVVPGDMLEKHILCADSYDGTLALTFKAVVTLTVCQNTLTAALRETGRVAKVKHTAGVLSERNIEKIRQHLGIANLQIEQFAEFGNKLASIKMSDREVADFHKALVFGDKPIPGVIDAQSASGQARRALGELAWLYTDGPGQQIEGRKGTAWGALNSVTAWTNHVKNHKRDVSTDRTQFVLYGTGDKINEEAKNLLINQYQLAA